MTHETSLGSAVNVTKETRQHLFFGMQFLRQTNLYNVQLSLSMKRSGIRIVMDHGERNLVLQIIGYDGINLGSTYQLRFINSS